MTHDNHHFSPSLHHQWQMRQTKPALAYSAGHVTAWQKRLRVKLRQLMGYGQAIHTPLNPQTLWKMPHPLGTIEKIVFTAEPYADVMAYLCLPRKVKPPYRCWICLQGHSTGAHVSIARDRDDETKPFKVEGDRDFGIGAMRRGYAALCIEQRSFGQRREQVQVKRSVDGCHDATMHALMLGKTLIGERVYDVERGLDYLAQRGDMDMQHIGVMGNSGGGTTTLFSAALLSRIAYAMPSCYLCTFADSLMSIYHCADNYIPGLLKVADMADIMGLFAPKPVTIVAGMKDEIFPIDGVRHAFDQLKKIYRAAGAADACQLVVGKGGHRFYARPAWQTMQSMMRD